MEEDKIIHFSIEIIKKFGELMDRLPNTLENIFGRKNEDFFEDINLFPEENDIPEEETLQGGNISKNNTVEILGKAFDPSTGMGVYMENPEWNFQNSSDILVPTSGKSEQQMPDIYTSLDAVEGQIRTANDGLTIHNVDQTSEYERQMPDIYTNLNAVEEQIKNGGLAAHNTEQIQKWIEMPAEKINGGNQNPLDYNQAFFENNENLQIPEINETGGGEIYRVPFYGNGGHNTETRQIKYQETFPESNKEIAVVPTSGQSNYNLRDTDYGYPLALNPNFEESVNNPFTQPATKEQYLTNSTRFERDNSANVIENAANTIAFGSQTQNNINVTINDGLISNVQNNLNSSSDNPEAEDDNFMWQLSKTLQTIVNDLH